MGGSVVHARLMILLGRWGLPPDDVAWGIFALGAFCILATLSGRDVLEGMWRASRARFLAGAGLIAAFLTLGYAAHYLRGGPRIIDATTYVLQAKALAHGHISWHVPWPSASFRGRFLLFREPDQLAGIFPPGWPLLLSIGFIVGSPMLVGIALSAALVIATYALTLELAPDRTKAEGAARLAASLSVVCAALRYQTADPMSHAASALGVTIALACALRAARTGSTRDFVATGACIGYVACTRPVSAIPIFVVALVALRTTSLRSLGAFLPAIVPGIVFLLLAQRAATGSAFTSTQQAYYAISDGPPGCFRYGFGDGIGCLHEHGDFVRSRLAHGYGLVAALGTTIRRLHTHLSDAVDAWPVLVLLAPLCVVAARRESRLRLAWGLVALQVVVYAPFYFDGDYPGAGARFFADVLSVEHAAIAVSVAILLPRIPLPKKSAILVGLIVVGFGLHGAHDALALADRDGGRPMFEPERLQDAHLESGLLFINTDHGFDLAHDPFVTDAKHGLVVARLHADGHDRLLYDRLGHPPSWAYRFGDNEPTLQPYTPPAAEVAGREVWRFESEVDWPPLAQHGAWAEPIWATGSRQNCPSGGQALAVHSSNGGEVTIALPIPRRGGWSIRPTVLADVGDGPIDLRFHGSAVDGARVDVQWASPAQHALHPTCVELTAQTVDLEEGEATIEIHVSSASAALDRIELTPFAGH